jgi:basic membrane protein A
VLDAAKARRVWGVGVDTDQSFLGPHVLTSVLKRYDVPIYSELRKFKEGSLRTGGTTSLGLKQNAVGLGKISQKVPRDFVKQVERIRVDIVAGRIRVPSRLS